MLSVHSRQTVAALEWLRKIQPEVLVSPTPSQLGVLSAVPFSCLKLLWLPEWPRRKDRVIEHKGLAAAHVLATARHQGALMEVRWFKPITKPALASL